MSWDRVKTRVGVEVMVAVRVIVRSSSDVLCVLRIAVKVAVKAMIGVMDCDQAYDRCGGFAPCSWLC